MNMRENKQILKENQESVILTVFCMWKKMRLGTTKKPNKPQIFLKIYSVRNRGGKKGVIHVFVTI